MTTIINNGPVTINIYPSKPKLRLKEVKCSKCKGKKIITEFISESGYIYASCQYCRTYNDRYYHGTNLRSVIKRKIEGLLAGDRKHNRPYTDDNKIDVDHCMSLINQHRQLYGDWCMARGEAHKHPMIFENIKKAKNQFTFDRTNDNLAHTKDNVKHIICYSCNSSNFFNKKIGKCLID